MNIQIFFVVLFMLNLVVVWLSGLTGKLRGYRFIAVLIFITLPFISVFFNQPRFELDYFWWRISGIVAMVAGFGVAFWATLVLKDISMLMPGPSQKLLTSGPYHYVRHPLYLGMIFVFVGWWWVWAAVYSFYFGMFILALVWAQAYLEEKLILEKQFGKVYQQYRCVTGMFWIK